MSGNQVHEGSRVCSGIDLLTEVARVCLISLGCPKNLVDSEYSLAALIEAGHDLENDVTRADVVVINTCGFIESAREESRQTISDAAALKRDGNLRGLIVVGCYAQRSGAELMDRHPEIDLVLGIGHPSEIAGAVGSVLDSLTGRDFKSRSIEGCIKPPDVWQEHTSRIVSTPPWTAYLKISDGCMNRCAYCAIPDIRGPYRSRPFDFVVEEAEVLAANGVKELVLVGQDTTLYGTDLESGHDLSTLLQRLNRVDGLEWIRLMYCYPTRLTEELIDTIASSERVAKYVDLPMQHGDDRVLAMMNRKGTSDEYLRTVDSIRKRCPEMAFRSSFIVGFPGEDEAAFDNLVRFVRKLRFDRVGVFQYSPEEDTPACGYPNQVSEGVKADRYDRLMRVQQEISLARNRAMVGRRIDVLVEGFDSEGPWGRSYRDAPEIDGLVYLRGVKAGPGDFVRVKVVEASEYDLVAK